ncbi:MAG: TetR/AcrR family transcriptional regulator [Gaiellales bacterium]
MEATTVRLTADERRESVLAAAQLAFAQSGFYGASTEDIATAAGISQPYLFRLFGTKKQLFVSSVERCFETTLESFRTASEQLHGDEALRAMGEAYVEMVRSDRSRLMGQLQAYAAADDPEICAVIKTGYGRLYEFVEARSGLSQEKVAQWFACGMLLNVIAALDLWTAKDPWVGRMIGGCLQHEGLSEELRT